MKKINNIVKENKPLILPEKFPEVIEAQVLNQNDFDMRKESIWMQDKDWFYNYVGKDTWWPLVKKIYQLCPNESDRKFATRLFAKMIKRRLAFKLWDGWSAKIVPTSDGCETVLNREGRFFDHFPFEKAAEGKIHVVPSVKFSNWRIFDFAIFKKGSEKNKKGLILEVQTNRGHLYAQEKHRDCELGQWVTFNTTFQFLEVSSWQTYGESHIGCIDQLLDWFDSEYSNRNINFNKTSEKIEDDCPFC